MARKSIVHHPVSQSHSSSAKVADIAKRAQHGKEEILRLQEDLALDAALSPVVRNHLAIWSRKPLEALSVALTVHAKYGGNVGSFDAAGVSETVAYEEAITPLLDAAKGLVRRLEDSLITRRAKVGKQLDGLVFSLRGETRYSDDPQVERDLGRLEKLLKRRGPSKKKSAASSKSPPPTTATPNAPQPGTTPAHSPDGASTSNPAPKGNGATTPAVDVSIRSLSN